MYSITVRDHIMISHSLRGTIFGAAQNMHGATLIIDFEFIANHLDKYNIVIDIGMVIKIVKDEISPYNFKNLDELPEFKETNTTIDYLCHFFFTRIRNACLSNESISKNIASKQLHELKVTIHESHVAKASFIGSLLF